MPKRIKFEGQTHEFPDDFTDEEISQALSQSSPSSNLSMSSKNTQQQNNAPIGINPSDLNRSALDVIRDLGAGIARGSQNLASSLLEGGEYITRKGAEKLGKDLGHPVNVPYWNARQFMGLEGNNPIDLGAKIQSNNPDPLTMGIGQFAPAALSGGTNALRQILTQALYGASQASPQQENAFGLLPQGRGGAAIESGALAGLPFGIQKMLGSAKNVLNRNFTPETTAQNLLNKIGGGQSVAENIKELSKRLNYGQKTAKEEALIPKREVMSEQGESRTIPLQITGKDLINKVSNIFSSDMSEINKNNLSKLTKELKNYYKNKIDINDLVKRGENIFNHPGLSDTQINKLEESLIPEKKITGKYLKIKNSDKYYSELLQKAHDKYVSNPTFSNSDTLRSRLFKRINELSKRQKANTLTDSQEKEFSDLIKNRKAIIKDQDNLISTFSPENQDKYGQFNKLWREDVRSYEEAGNTVKNLNNNLLSNVTPDKITNAFSFPELKPQLQKVLKDIGPAGINNIIYNEIARVPTAKGIVNTLNNLEMNKGFAPYLTPEIKGISNQIKNQLRNKNALLWGLGGIGSLGAADLIYEGGKKALNAL